MFCPSAFILALAWDVNERVGIPTATLGHEVTLKMETIH